MKTSNKIFVAAVVLLLSTLTAYNVALRAEQRTGNYKDPLHNYTTLALRNFDAVSVPSASGLKVKIVAGPFAVRVSKEAADFVRVTQRGQQLLVSVAYPREPEYLGRQEVMVISCPRLAALTTDGTYTLAGQTPLGKLQTGGTVLVQGFRQDSLTVRQDRSNQIRLAGNTLGWLRAVVGTSPGSGPELEIESDNRIQAADLTIGHQGHLNLATGIPRLHQQFSDSASVTFSGAAARSLSAK
ncbi:hypothetical protein [Hymenobacter antarcticus]|uniref:Auto-transporter adhesin head GIN domain-containing protein n=1 Tax=Hymenobacter antarcticus TaxID=486270 RepID=A0ABP7QH82_9BACT